MKKIKKAEKKEIESITFSINLIMDPKFSAAEKILIGYLLYLNKRVIYFPQERATKLLNLSRTAIGKILNDLEFYRYIDYVLIPEKRYKYIVIRDELLPYRIYKKTEIEANFELIKNLDLREKYEKKYKKSRIVEDQTKLAVELFDKLYG